MEPPYRALLIGEVRIVKPMRERLTGNGFHIWSHDQSEAWSPVLGEVVMVLAQRPYGKDVDTQEVIESGAWISVLYRGKICCTWAGSIETHTERA